ncbi:M20 metallopeptidase family protein [Lacicoccus alkaliphilus]|uniref:Amidohydrolase n=1 Tax=Lacicoccus alkaliphilus DSM 16010 TaxID=1123231 RepID=A0A1M7B2A2_9BACL|nr:M20 family metallopeptidase [Salinicoccus alkaliphilus]SHL49113.1 amidohydrolase [Salinicoccus alkaliphilus DSM 16010]
MTEIKFVSEHRRYLHENPELSMKEFGTTSYIIEVLESLGINYTQPLPTGVVAYLKGESETTLGFRADIDALPIHEENDVPYRSSEDGVMHACGHDGHTAALLLFAKRCKALSDEGKLPHNCYFIFQPSEETMAGAKQLLDSWSGKEAMDAVFGIHIMPDEETGLALFRDHEMTASATEYRFYIKGESAHVANKQHGKSALEALMFTTREISQIQQFHLDGLNRNIIHLGRMDAGEAINTVPSNAYLEGTIRTYEEDDLAVIKGQMDKIRAAAEVLYDCKVEVTYNEGYPPVKNDPELRTLAHQSVESAGLEPVIKEKPYLFGEDFSFYSEVAPTYFVFIGAGDREKGYTSSLHTSTFNFDESILITVADYYENILKNYKH